MSAGLIDADQAAIIAAYASCLSPEDAAKADEILAPEAPEVRADTLARRAAALEMKLDPESDPTSEADDTQADGRAGAHDPVSWEVPTPEGPPTTGTPRRIRRPTSTSTEVGPRVRADTETP